MEKDVYQRDDSLADLYYRSHAKTSDGVNMSNIFN